MPNPELDQELYESSGAKAMNDALQAGAATNDFGGISELFNVISSSDQDITALKNELISIEGRHARQHPESTISDSSSYVSEYTNRIFGTPYQFLGSVDGRFGSINPLVGAEYMKQFILHAPILSIKPGIPKFTGQTKGLFRRLMAIIQGCSEGNSLSALLANVWYDSERFQMRMFSFSQQYYDYIRYVNYMCRAMAVYLDLVDSTSDNDDDPEKITREEVEEITITDENASTITAQKGKDATVLLTGDTKMPHGCFVTSGNQWEEFRNFRWENYKMLSSKYYPPLKDKLVKIANYFGHLFDPKGAADLEDGVIAAAANGDTSQSKDSSVKDEEPIDEFTGNANYAVRFLVNPITVQKTLTNNTAESMIENKIKSTSEGIGSEIAFITQSKADAGLLGDLTTAMGGIAQTSLKAINESAQPIIGSFFSSVFGSAINAVKGQKMIYPKIYKNSESEGNREFSLHLHSPYGDNYNYYMNIVVPLMHILAFSAPRMINANTYISPFIVQAYIPGLYTCQLGIIHDVSIKYNTEKGNVSVNGFPLDVEVTFSIDELYHNFSISPEYDPGSFLFNESLNDYLCNMAGLAPCKDTNRRKRDALEANVVNYFGGVGQRIVNALGKPFIDLWDGQYSE